LVDLPSKIVENKRCLFEMKDLSQDQEPIVRIILSKVKEWVELNRNNDTKELEKFKPLRLTIRGKAGTGKSFITKVIRTALMRLFGRNDPIVMGAPTGSAAFNIDGETIHRIASIKVNQVNRAPCSEKQKEMIKQYKSTVGVIIDERSLLSCEVLGAAEKHLSMTMHGGTHESEDWGGLPIVVLIGDDYQLPPPSGISKGAFHTVAEDIHSSLLNMNDNVCSNGCIQFRNFAGQSMELTTNHRQNSSNSQLDHILSKIRICEPTREDARVLVHDHHLGNKSPGVVKTICQGALFLFGTRAQRDEHNIKRLCEESSCSNPVAILKPRYSSNVQSKVFKSHFETKETVTPLLCRGSMVSIQGKNFHPKWGLYNGAIGTLKDFHFSEGSNPNCGDLPDYISVEFPEYRGPIWDKSRPKVIIPCLCVNRFLFVSINVSRALHTERFCFCFPTAHKVVPIPMYDFNCKNQCCNIKYCPLQLSYARTIHTFQGSEAGTDKAIHRLIVDCGTKRQESSSPGLFYSALSRATHLESYRGANDSAIYFIGENVSIDRILSLGKKANGEPHYLVMLRSKWIQLLEKGNIVMNNSMNTIEDLDHWFENNSVSNSELDLYISRSSWRKQMCVNPTYI
jgi:hypothetical protein